MAGVDQYTKLLLHMDSLPIVDSSFYTKTIGNTDVDITDALSKFGGFSGHFDGNDYLYSAHSTDWEFGTGNFTIDLWVNFSTVTKVGFVSHGGPIIGSDRLGWVFMWQPDDNTIAFREVASGTSPTFQISYGWIPTTNVWYHVAVSRSGNNFYLFINGSVVATSSTTSSMVVSSSYNLKVGTNSAAEWSLNGYMDEVRISKGIARWTSNFTPPTVPYLPPTITGSTNQNGVRALVIDNTSWAIEHNSVLSAGDYDINFTNTQPKTIVAINSAGETVVFGNVTPHE